MLSARSRVPPAKRTTSARARRAHENNISVPEHHRRRGYGRLATAAVLRDAYASGARTAFLHSSPMAVPLYEGMGFRTAGNWTVCHA